MYLLIDEVRAALKNGMGEQCDVDQYIDQYLEREAAAPEIDVPKEDITEKELAEMADAAEVFNQFINKKTNEMQNMHEQYVNSDYKDLITYKKGSMIMPVD